MERLRATIAQYGRWQELSLYVDRMEGHLESDFSISIENAKALLESIGKEICCTKGITLGSAPSINAVLKSTFLALGYANENLVNQVSRSLANIGQELGNLRNEVSPTSHGKSLDELRERNNKIDLLTREFLIDSTLVIAIFLIRAFEERTNNIGPQDQSVIEEETLGYEEFEDFNNYWDDFFGEFSMDTYSYTASEILYNVDFQAYRSEYKAFRESETENNAIQGD
ncbi:abortive infection family protein [Methylobacter luteus]|uniref:abortive infection family protein n=1 Tax=Methylobacter luteus TaxID=415 RepID=UPI000409C651|nr:abortive infection family protein [Methylobacter luteus]